MQTWLGLWEHAVTGIRWPSANLLQDWTPPPQGSVCAVMWPTRRLQSRERWFDELYAWTEGFEARTMQRAFIQHYMLKAALGVLERESLDRIAVTLSFGTVERLLDALTELFENHTFVMHRMAVMLRGQVERLRSPYRVKGFVDWLQAHGVAVGYRISAPRISMEMAAIDLLRPDFLKVAVPPSRRLEYWQDMVVEARMSGIESQHIIMAGIEDKTQRQLAMQSGFGFGQGSAIKPAFDPPIRLSPWVHPRPRDTATLGGHAGIFGDLGGEITRPDLQFPFAL